MQPAILQIDRPVRVLVDRRKAVGDVLMITPVLRELRRRYGDSAYIQVVTEEDFVLVNEPYINSVIKPAELHTVTWDVCVNLNDAYEYNVTSHYVDAYLYRAFGHDINDIDKSLSLTTTPDEQEAVDDALTTLGTNYIVVHMRRWAWENKNVDPAVWDAIINWAGTNGVKVVCVGAQYDYRLPQTDFTVDLVEQLSLGEIRHLIANAKMFIGGDSGPYHIAATTSTPIIALLSHLLPEQILPWRDGKFGKNVYPIQSDVPCAGCYNKQTPPVRNLTCTNPVQWACSKAFDTKRIIKTIEEILTL
jgi:ADP-heptose:LPS heptosyltransferase